uniref:Uncharacterized protein n=1 Tax=Kalanchoe fedtschenkoi TaxID=63787 RepID=A0A7N0VLE6_KALFE
MHQIDHKTHLLDLQPTLIQIRAAARSSLELTSTPAAPLLALAFSTSNILLLINFEYTCSTSNPLSSTALSPPSTVNHSPNCRTITAASSAGSAPSRLPSASRTGQLVQYRLVAFPRGLS